jgi:Cu(I)/Ag(I) efflux system membrane fusion protein
MKTFTFSLVALLVGASLGYVASSKLSLSDEMTMSSSEESKPPLYWVAPMDPNYKRDKPGKSPMGMDLIPVYEETSANVEPGTVQIDANVENNLGVKSAEVEYAKLSAQIDTVGYIGFDQSKMWQINPRVSGWIEALNVDAIGEKVKQGDVLFELYSPELVKAQEELLSAYRSGRKALIKGATDRLVSLGVDREQINALKRRGAASQTIAIKAPKDGVIASLSIREGGYLSPAKEALSAGTIDEVWVEAEIFERQSQLVNEGDEVVMKLDALPGKEWGGEVD